MSIKKTSILTLACLVLLFPAIAPAQIDLVAPPDGAAVSSPPTFEWTTGDYDFFVFYSIFNYTGFGYHPILLGWYPITSLEIPTDWWDMVAVDIPSVWLVLGYDIDTSTFGVAPFRTFTKVESDMSEIPGGCYSMGADSPDCNLIDECPVHTVCITAFEMDRYEVTNSEYAECVAAGSCTAPQHTRSSTRLYYYGQTAYDNYPVLYVNWQQAVDYCAWEGKRLPTEGEWEYAARGGLSGATYPWGNSISGSDANYLNSGDPEDNDTNEVGSYPANGYGLYDVAGNVYEWVYDLYDNLYYNYSPRDDPTGPATGDSRVQRGGSWGHSTGNQRVANRHYRLPVSVANDVGFRCAR